MTENYSRLQNFRSYDIGIKAWIKTAGEIISQFGGDSIVEYPAVVPLGGIPLLTVGAYTCYAGVVQSPTSGLFLFHLYEKDAYNQLVSAIGGDPIAGVVGGVPLNQKRKSANQFANTALEELYPKHASLGGFNIIALPDNEILYAAGQSNIEG